MKRTVTGLMLAALAPAMAVRAADVTPASLDARQALLPSDSAVADQGTEYRAFTRAPFAVALPPAAPVVAATDRPPVSPTVPIAGHRSRTEDTIEVAM